MLPIIAIANINIPTYLILYFLCGFIAYRVFFRFYITQVGITNALAGLAVLVFGALGGAVLFHNLMSEEDYSLFSVVGYSQYGAILGGVLILATLLNRQVESHSRFELYHRFGILITIGAACSRFACFLKGCCWGAISHAPWAVIYENSQSAMFYQGVPVHPFQIYEVILVILILPMLAALKNNWRIHGTLGFFILFPLVRIFTDTFRPAPHRPEGFFPGYSFNQSVSLLILVTALVLLLRTFRKLSREETRNLLLVR